MKFYQCPSYTLVQIQLFNQLYPKFTKLMNSLHELRHCHRCNLPQHIPSFSPKGTPRVDNLVSLHPSSTSINHQQTDSGEDRKTRQGSVTSIDTTTMSAVLEWVENPRPLHFQLWWRRRRVSFVFAQQTNKTPFRARLTKLVVATS